MVSIAPFSAISFQFAVTGRIEPMWILSGIVTVAVLGMLAHLLKAWLADRRTR